MKESGKFIRLSRIFNPFTNKTLIVPMDHGVTMGPARGLEDIKSIIDKIEEGSANAVVLHKGMIRFAFQHYRKIGLIVHLSASTQYSSEPNFKIQVETVRHAISLGADGISVHVNLGAEKESQMLASLGKISEECDLYGLPLLVMIYPRGPRIKSEFDVNALKHGVRLAAELGADIVKTNYCGNINDFRKIIEGCPIPVVIAGGPKISSTMELLSMVKDAIDSGASGVSIGRNIFQHEDPVWITRAISQIIHKEKSVKEVMEER